MESTCVPRGVGGVLRALAAARPRAGVGHQRPRRAAAGGDRDRQGGGRRERYRQPSPEAPTAVPPRPPPSTPRPFRTRWWRAPCSATSKGPFTGATDTRSWPAAQLPTVAASSWTRWATCPQDHPGEAAAGHRDQPGVSRWARTPPMRWTSATSPPPTRTCTPWWSAVSSARTSSSDWRATSSRFPPLRERPGRHR